PLRTRAVLAALALAAIPGTAAAADAPVMNAGDTAWMLMATALVMIMLPGLALFYGGLVRRKNVLSTIMHSFFGLAIVSVVWVLVGFSLAFGPDATGAGLIGNLDYVGFFNLGALDFAGGTVVHASSGLSALIVALLIGRRVGNGEGLEPHDIPMTVLGAGLLWFGWFGFNAGSAVAANGLAASAFIVTNTAAAAAT